MTTYVQAKHASLFLPKKRKPGLPGPEPKWIVIKRSKKKKD